MDKPIFDNLSLRSQLLNWLMLPLLVLLIFASAVGYLASINFANLPYDRALFEVARTLAANVRLVDGRPTMDMAISARNILLNDPDDRIFYKITLDDGRLIAGETWIPSPLGMDEFNDKYLTDAELREEKYRVATLRVTPDFGPEWKEASNGLLIHVAETFNKRQALTRKILGTMMIPQLLLIALAGGGLWFGLNRGIFPLKNLQRTLSQRSASDLSPVELREDIPEEVVPLITAFNGILLRMRGVLAAQKRFVADAAHQLRTPLAGLKTQAELALRLNDPSSIRRALQQILQSAERGSSLTNQLLTLARHEPGDSPERATTAVNINEIVKHTTLTLVNDALRKNIDLGFEPSAEPAWVVGDELGLIDMLTNLLDNAIRYTHAGGRVTARVNLTDNAVLVSVEDNGPGILPADRERVFERFYRVLGNNETGSGLGLAIVREIARLHQADIVLDDAPGGRGALFSIRFARTLAPAESKIMDAELSSAA
ncbi:MAG: sensor histidine kinase N-terminal domain-containing protein [Burkholderiales bacterium]